MPPKKPVQSAVPWDELQRPFDDDQITWTMVKAFELRLGRARPEKCYKLHPYVKAEIIAARLNCVLTPGLWSETYRVFSTKEGFCLMCRLGIYDPKSMEWITREGGALAPEKREFEDYKGFRQSYVSSWTTLAFRAAALRFDLGVDTRELDEVLAGHVRTEGIPTDREVIKFEIEAESSTHGMVKQWAWCERPKLSELRK